MTKDYIDRIEDIRRNNNRLWMNILRIAYKRAPKQTKQILKEIDVNDKKISKLLRKMTNGGNTKQE